MPTGEAAGSAASLAGPSAEAAVPRGRIHVKRLLACALVIGVLGLALDLLGWDIGAWFGRLWEAMTGISPAYLALGLALQTAQTTLTALAWLAIVRYAYPAAEIP